MTSAFLLGFAMRLIAVAVTAFVIPFGVLGYFGVIDPLGRARGAHEAVEGWLEEQKAGRAGEAYWKDGASNLAPIERIDAWEIGEVTPAQAEVTIWRKDRHGVVGEGEAFLFRLTETTGERSDNVFQIAEWKNLSDQLPARARLAAEWIEDWFELVRANQDGSDRWAEGVTPTRIPDLVRWEMTMPPQDGRKVSANFSVIQRGRDGAETKSTWNIRVEFLRESGAARQQPRITGASNLSD